MNGSKHFCYFLTDGTKNKNGFQNFKTGRTEDPYQRIKDLQSGNPNHLEIELMIEISDIGSYYTALNLEREIKLLLTHEKTRYLSEWFAGPITDCFVNSLKKAGNLPAEIMIMPDSKPAFRLINRHLRIFVVEFNKIKDIMRKVKLY